MIIKKIPSGFQPFSILIEFECQADVDRWFEAITENEIQHPARIVDTPEIYTYPQNQISAILKSYESHKEIL